MGAPTRAALTPAHCVRSPLPQAGEGLKCGEAHHGRPGYLILPVAASAGQTSTTLPP